MFMTALKMIDNMLGYSKTSIWISWCRILVRIKIRLKLIQTLNKAQYHLVDSTENAVNQDFWLLYGIIGEPTGKKWPVLGYAVW